MIADARALTLVLALRPEWGRIDLVRQAVACLLQGALADAQLMESISLVAAELLENAMRYGQAGHAGVQLTLCARASELSMEVRNEIDPATDHVRTLEAKLAWLSTFKNMADAYVAALRAVYENRSGTPECGLGLVRAAYEGGCQLSAAVARDGRLTVRAVRRRRA